MDRDVMRAVAFVVLVLAVVGVRHCPVTPGMVAPRARLARGYAAPEGRDPNLGWSSC